MLKATRLFDGGGDYSKQEAQELRDRLDALKGAVQESVAERLAAVEGLRDKQTTALDEVATRFNEKRQDCQRDLALREGLGTNPVELLLGRERAQQRVASGAVVQVVEGDAARARHEVGLRNLQHEDQLKHLLAGLKREHSALHRQHQKYVPLTVKIAPDMDDETAVNTASIIKEEGIDGIVVSNTTVERAAVVGEKHAQEQGGLSGVPVRDDAGRVLKAVADAVGGSVAIVGVGGINSGEDAARKIHLGADLVQIYTGFIYQGPKLIADSVRSIDKLRAS